MVWVVVVGVEGGREEGIARGFLRGELLTGCLLIVDGGAWRTAAGNPGSGFVYPDFLLKDEVITGVKGGKKAKL